jgi:ABC-type uncharacterized transport system ATPase subunit
MALLELESVHRHFGGVRAVDGVDLALERGELRALIGPNGCGKSTLFNLITGALRPTSGRIRFHGRDVTGLAPQHIARAGVGRKFQVTSVFDELSVEDNLRVALWRQAAMSLDGLLARLRLTERRQVAAGVLSHGERQWVEIGMVLAASPTLLLLDEPTAGMTAPETAATVDLIRSIAASGEVTVLVIEHDVGFLERLDCAVTVMAKGRILRTGSFAEVRADSEIRALYFGNAA